MQLADEMQQELLEIKSENWMLKCKVETENERTAVLAAMPRLAFIRDNVLNKLKVGRQSLAGKALNAFIKELESIILATPTTQK